METFASPNKTKIQKVRKFETSITNKLEIKGLFQGHNKFTCGFWTFKGFLGIHIDRYKIYITSVLVCQIKKGSIVHLLDSVFKNVAFGIVFGSLGDKLHGDFILDEC
jgi:hypothetical protein